MDAFRRSSLASRYRDKIQLSSYKYMLTRRINSCHDQHQSGDVVRNDDSDMRHIWFGPNSNTSRVSKHIVNKLLQLRPSIDNNDNGNINSDDYTSDSDDDNMDSDVEIRERNRHLQRSKRIRRTMLTKMCTNDRQFISNTITLQDVYELLVHNVCTIFPAPSKFNRLCTTHLVYVRQNVMTPFITGSTPFSELRSLVDSESMFTRVEVETDMTWVISELSKFQFCGF